MVLVGQQPGLGSQVGEQLIELSVEPCVSGTLRSACLTSRMASMTSLSSWLRLAAGSSRRGGLTWAPMRVGGLAARLVLQRVRPESRR
jgi:hypothetical protein